MTIDAVKLQAPPYLPFFNTEAIEFLESILQPQFEIFEYGSGGSTIFLAEHVKRVVSVEDSMPFYAEVKRVLDSFNLKNVEIIFIESAGILGGKALDNYIHAIDAYPNKSFDIVVCDGTDNSRGQLARIAKPKVKPGGWLVVDDLGWDPVIRGIEKARLEDWPCVICTGRVVGIIPGVSTGPGDTQTAFFRCPIHGENKVYT